MRVALPVVRLRREDLDRLLDKTPVRMRDDRHAPRLQHTMHLRKHGPGVGQVLHAQRHGDEVECLVLPWQFRVVIEVLHEALRRYSVDVQLRLVEAVHNDSRAFEQLRREVRYPRRAHIQNCKPLRNRREGAAVHLREPLQGGVVEVVDQTWLLVHVDIGRLVHARKVLGGIRPRRRRPAVLRIHSHAHRGIGVGLREFQLCSTRPRHGHAHPTGLLEDLAQHIFPVLDRAIPSDLQAVARDALTQEEVGHLSDVAAQVLVNRLDLRAPLIIRQPSGHVLGNEARLLGSRDEDGLVGDVLRVDEVAAGERLHHLMLLPALLRCLDEHERVERVDHPTAGVQLEPELQPGQAQGIRLGMRVLLRVAMLPKQVVVEALSLLRYIRIEKHGAVPKGGALAQAHGLHRPLKAQEAQEGDRAADVREHIDDKLRGGRRVRAARRRAAGRQGEHLGEHLETLGVRVLHTRLGGRHEPAERSKALAHCDVEVAGVHHGVPTCAHRDVLATRRCVAERVPGSVPEVAEVEAGDPRRSRAEHRVAASVDHAARIDLREGAHLHEHPVSGGHHLADLARGGHHKQACAFGLVDEHGRALVNVPLLVQDSDEVGVDVPRQPVLASLCAVCGHYGLLVLATLEGLLGDKHRAVCIKRLHGHRLCHMSSD
mmetsp:Transcript_92611/g.267423  ORF Transcript_92611/g.267423 Transcript_92611/m.267423 type:complete len:657 (-) Transcript_92611:140-2110(-)